MSCSLFKITRNVPRNSTQLLFSAWRCVRSQPGLYQRQKRDGQLDRSDQPEWHHHGFQHFVEDAEVAGGDIFTSFLIIRDNAEYC